MQFAIRSARLLEEGSVSFHDPLSERPPLELSLSSEEPHVIGTSVKV